MSRPRSATARARTVRALLLALLTVHAGLLAWSGTRHSPAIDEVGHLAAGLSHWQTEAFDLYRVNPPLVRTVATAPLAALGLQIREMPPAGDPRSRPEFELGRQFVSAHGERAFWYFTLARWACLPFSLLGAYVCYRWARDLYGPVSGLMAAALWCFSPNVLANAQMITPDTGAAALGLAAGYLFWRWLRAPGWGRAFAAGCALGLAELCKASWVFLFALWPALWFAGRLFPPPHRPARSRWHEVGQLGTMLLLALYVLNAGYGFEGTFTPLGEYPFVSRALTAESAAGARANRFRGTRLGGVPVPVPRNYLLGIDVQKNDFERGFRSYLRGEWRHGGWWYYYLYGLAVKVPLGTWLLLGLAAAFQGWGSWRARGVWRAEVVLLAPAVVLLALVSSQTGFNHHLRYVLPVLPCLFVWAGRVVPAARRAGRWAVVAVTGALLWSVTSSLSVYPHSLSYFNEAAGGPERGGEHFVDSNLDWGQDLLYLKRWYDAHPEARPFGLAYFGYIDPRAAGIEFEPPPRGPLAADDVPDTWAAAAGPRPGWYAVSVSMLRGNDFPIPDGRGSFVRQTGAGYSYFQRFKPVGRAGYSIWIYHLTDADCRREDEQVTR